ncbi:MAG TPA: hypothetical protein VGK73_30670, partial [Polyangiaceae bacterium]
MRSAWASVLCVAGYSLVACGISRREVERGSAAGSSGGGSPPVLSHGGEAGALAGGAGGAGGADEGASGSGGGGGEPEPARCVTAPGDHEEACTNSASCTIVWDWLMTCEDPALGALGFQVAATSEAAFVGASAWEDTRLWALD